MDPDGSGACRLLQPMRRKAQALRQSGTVLAQAQHLERPPGERDQYHTGQKQAVKDIHEGLDILCGRRASCANPLSGGIINAVKIRRIAVFLALATSLLFCGDKHFSPPPAAHARTYPLHDAHDDEKVTIAVDPYDAPDKASVFKVNYRGYSFFVVRLIVSNDSDKTLMMDDLKVEYITAKREKLQPASDTDIYRRLVKPEKADNSHPGGMKLPFPVGKKKEPLSKDVREEYESAQFLTVPVTAHATNSGFVFFDMAGMDTPGPGAHVYISGVKAGSQQLFYFDISMGKAPEPAAAK